MTILIVEEHEAVRNALRDWLEISFPDQRVVDTASDEEAISLTSTEFPQLVLLDIDISRLRGFDTMKKIKATSPSAQVIILTIHEDSMYRTFAKSAGASAFVPKRILLKNLKHTISELLCTNSKSHPENPQND